MTAEGSLVAQSRHPVVPYAYYARIGSGHTPSRSNDAYWEDCDIPWVTTGDVKHLRSGKLQVLTETEHRISKLGMRNSAARLHHEGTVFLSRTASVGFSGIMGRPMATSQDFVTWTPGQGLDARFLLWVLRALKANGDFDRMMYGSTHKTIYYDELAQLRGPLPSLEVQRQVADMLDAETARIDTLIAKNHAVRKLLQTRWQSLLERRIFIDQDVSACPLWLICEITPGYAYSSDDFLYGDGPVRLLRGVNVGIGTLNWEETVYAADDVVDTAPQYRLREGDIVLGMDRPWISSGLRVARIGAQDLPAALVQRVARLRPRGGLEGDYLYLALQSRRFFAAFEPAMTGVSVPHVSGGQIGDFALPLPDAGAQRAVVDRLTQESARIRELAERVEQQVKLLRQRRQALITAAVTGQINVWGN